jgi:hypothetical protein
MTYVLTTEDYHNINKNETELIFGSNEIYCFKQTIINFSKTKTIYSKLETKIIIISNKIKKITYKYNFRKNIIIPNSIITLIVHTHQNKKIYLSKNIIYLSMKNNLIKYINSNKIIELCIDNEKFILNNICILNLKLSIIKNIMKKKYYQNKLNLHTLSNIITLNTKM